MGTYVLFCIKRNMPHKASGAVNGVGEMQQIIRKRQGEKEIDLGALLHLFWRKMPILLVCTIVCGIISLSGAAVFISPGYTGDITLYANNFKDNKNANITAGDLSASAKLVDTYAAIILSDPVLDKVIAETGIDATADSLSKKITVESINQTEVFKVSVEAGSPEEAADIANAIARIAPIKISEIVDGCSVKVISLAKAPAGKSSPNYLKICFAGAAAGLLISAVVVFALAALDTTIKSETDMEEWDLPVIGMVPEFTNAEQSGEKKNFMERLVGHEIFS